MRIQSLLKLRPIIVMGEKNFTGKCLGETGIIKLESVKLKVE